MNIFSIKLKGPKTPGVLGFLFGSLIDALKYKRDGKMFPMFVQDW